MQRMTEQEFSTLKRIYSGLSRGRLQQIEASSGKEKDQFERFRAEVKYRWLLGELEKLDRKSDAKESSA